MPYEHTVVAPFTAGGKTYAVGQKIADEAEAADLYAQHFGRNLSRHDVTTPAPEPEKAEEATAAPQPHVASAKPAPAPTAPAAAA